MATQRNDSLCRISQHSYIPYVYMYISLVAVRMRAQLPAGLSRISQLTCTGRLLFALQRFLLFPACHHCGELASYTHDVTAVQLPA